MPKTVPITNATYGELRSFAEARGLEVKQPSNANQVRSKILAAFPDTTDVPAIEDGPEQAAPPPAPTQAAEPEAAASAEPFAAAGRPSVPRCKIMLQSTKDGPKNVDVSINGKTYLMNVGAEVSVPYYVELALRNAKETSYELHQENARDRPEMVPTDSLLYPYSVLEPADKAEIAAWEAYSQNKFAPE